MARARVKGAVDVTFVRNVGRRYRLSLARAKLIAELAGFGAQDDE